MQCITNRITKRFFWCRGGGEEIACGSWVKRSVLQNKAHRRGSPDFGLVVGYSDLSFPWFHAVPLCSYLDSILKGISTVSFAFPVHHSQSPYHSTIFNPCSRESVANRFYAGVSWKNHSYVFMFPCHYTWVNFYTSKCFKNVTRSISLILSNIKTYRLEKPTLLSEIAQHLGPIQHPI